jgi:hypothetical protein
LIAQSPSLCITDGKTEAHSDLAKVPELRFGRAMLQVRHSGPRDSTRVGGNLGEVSKFSAVTWPL